MKTLETNRLILRDWEESDLEDMFAILSNPNGFRSFVPK